MYISNNAVIANLAPQAMRPLSRVKKLSESQSGDDFEPDESNTVPNRSNTPLATPRSALEQEMLEQILAMISSNKFDDKAIDDMKNLLSEDGGLCYHRQPARGLSRSCTPPRGFPTSVHDSPP